MSAQWKNRDQASALIQNALRSYFEGDFPKLKDSFWLGNSEELTEEQIMMGCTAFVFALNLTSGNSGQRNIYDLLKLYLGNENAREEINIALTSRGVKLH